MTLSLILSLLWATAAHAHGGLVIPPPRNNYNNSDPREIVHPWTDGRRLGGPCAGSACLWFNEGCFSGCPSCIEGFPMLPANFSPSAQMNYYGKPNCDRPTGPTLPEKYRTWNIKNLSPFSDYTKYHPWRSPGHAPTSDPCGVAGGYAKPTGGGGETPMGATQGDRGSALPRHAEVRTEWPAGGVAEVGWMLAANHGGGYLYSLCPAGSELTEACLDQMPLAYADSFHTIRYIAGPEEGTELIINATDVSVGTHPVGSAWRVNPIPACNCDKGFGCSVGGSAEGGDQAYWNGTNPTPKGFDCPTGTAFQPPFDYGYGQQLWDLGPGTEPPEAMNTWVIIDHLKVPAAKGEYVLRWRWDVEQNSQIWSHCADVTIV
eukprot:CAMPEP_0181207818 /NCGR_PEP_ID=MMETSP1096-20121128/21792_1 /TAXON_ID=156174 ORGANISM="Chrysochromulina ericina, Strain CCMP281" /NCGR_SAMPLE_ID=MMETSP1096 /ASSEMBLY_ACC=CAM_ASM_000453 /LENGTH=374 /DNA_ID=CAMNT_0023298851 /DNA_START=49 /DNA_END=1173 /DNA_ORIENTATION=+